MELVQDFDDTGGNTNWTTTYYLWAGLSQTYESGKWERQSRTGPQIEFSASS